MKIPNNITELCDYFLDEIDDASYIPKVVDDLMRDRFCFAGEVKLTVEQAQEIIDLFYLGSFKRKDPDDDSGDPLENERRAIKMMGILEFKLSEGNNE